MGAVARYVALLLAAEASPFSLESLLIFFSQGCSCSGAPYVHSICIFRTTESLLPLSLGSTKAFFSVLGSVLEEYIVLVLEASSSSPLVPSGGVVEFNDVDNELVREPILKNVESCFFIEGIPCFVCKALELSNVVVEVLLLHLEFSELPLRLRFNGGISVRIGESIDNCVPQVFFGGEYSSYYLIHQPFCLFCNPIIGVWSSDEG